MFFITGIIIAALFLVSTSVPFLSWLLPYYKIKKFEGTNLKTIVVTNLIAMIIIGWVDYKLLITYVVVYGLIEALYFILERYGKKVEYLDKVFIISLVIGGLICVYMYFNRVSLNLNFNQIQNLYLQKTNFTKAEVDMAFRYIRERFPYLIFIYTNMTIFLMYYFLKKDNFTKWEVSYLWLIPYIIFFFLGKYIFPENIFISNALDVLKIVYILYFIKNITKFLYTRISRQNICFVIAVCIAFISPEFAFIFGALLSGVKIQIIRMKRR